MQLSPPPALMVLALLTACTPITFPQDLDECQQQAQNAGSQSKKMDMVRECMEKRGYQIK